MKNVIASGANFVRSDLGECDVTNADFTEAVIDKYQAIQLCDYASGTNPFTGVDTRRGKVYFIFFHNRTILFLKIVSIICCSCLRSLTSATVINHTPRLSIDSLFM